MPDQTEQPAADPRDIRIKELEAEVKALTADINDANEHIDEISAGYESQIDKLNAQLKKKAPASLPTGDVVILGGQQYPVVRTVRANTTFDEVKKGNVDEGVTLVVIAAPH